MPKQDLSNQIAIVTGGTRGIGAGVTRALLACGARVIATYGGNAAAAEAFLQSLPDEERQRCQTRAFDVADAVLYLLGPLAGYVTGAVLEISGGL